MSKKKARPADPDEYDGMVKHIRFEFEILAITLDRVEAPVDETDYAERMNHAAYGDALLVKLRNVWAFFANDRGDPPTGMVARYYADGWDRETDGGEALLKLAKCIDPISTRVAHISVTRERDKRPILDFGSIRAVVDELLAHFDTRLDHQWANRFHTSLDAAAEHVRCAGVDGSPRAAS